VWRRASTFLKIINYFIYWQGFNQGLRYGSFKSCHHPRKAFLNLPLIAVFFSSFFKNAHNWGDANQETMTLTAYQKGCKRCQAKLNLLQVLEELRCQAPQIRSKRYP
jgi:hypothetical protein